MSFRSLSLLLLLATLPAARADERWAPNAVAGPVDQLRIAGNACGPAALLTSIRCGGEEWQAVAAKLPGDDDRNKLRYIIRAHGLRPSASLRDRKRWSRDGINAEDLTDVAAELAAIGGLRPPKREDLFLRKRESPEKLVDRMHDRFRDSLKHGFPPVLSLRRYVFRNGNWQSLEGHFVSIVMVPERLPRKASEFPVIYFDPWRGRKRSGRIRISDRPLLGADPAPCLIAELPDADIGRSKLRPGETSVIVPAIALGTW